MSTTANTPKQIGTAVYKGRHYALLWQGATQYGERMKLAFTHDLDESFWIDADRADSVELFDPPTDAQPDDKQPPRERSRKRRPADDGPRRTRQSQQDASATDAPPPEQADECYCASCGQLLSAPF
jgi:hypothetical protein